VCLVESELGDAWLISRSHFELKAFGGCEKGSVSFVEFLRTDGWVAMISRWALFSHMGWMSGMGYGKQIALSSGDGIRRVMASGDRLRLKGCKCLWWMSEWRKFNQVVVCRCLLRTLFLFVHNFMNCTASLHALCMCGVSASV